MTEIMTPQQYRETVKKPTRHKFNAQPTERDGMHFDSKLEARRYDQLVLLQRSGEVLFFVRQVPFHLPGSVKLVVDFEVFWADGSVTFEDTKGYETESFKAKRRIVETLYPIKIIVIGRSGRVLP